MKNKIAVLFSNNRTKYTLIAAGLIIIIVAGIFAWKALSPTDQQTVAGNDVTAATTSQASDINLSNIKIEPVISDSAGIDTKSGFKLYCDKTISPESIKEALSVTPRKDYTLAQISRGEYNISFNDELKGGSIYKLEFTDVATGSTRSWAFQTKKAFSIVRTLPRDEATQVPVDSGIEITFSHEKVENIKDYFEIDPKVEGRFEIHKKTVVFVPKKLDDSTIYTVTIKKGLGFSGSSDKLAGDYSFKFQTAVPSSDDRLLFSFYEGLFNFTSKAIPALQVYADDSLIGSAADIEIYRYADVRLYKEDLKKLDTVPYWAITDKTKLPFDIGSLEKIASSKAQIAQYKLNYYNLSYLLLPSSLDEGYYLVKAVAGGNTEYVHLQISNSVVYIMVATNKTLVWANDAITGNPIENALVSSDYYESAKTDATGMATLDGAIEQTGENHFYFNLSAEGRPEFIAQTEQNRYPIYQNGEYVYYGYDGGGNANKYWTYLYLDKDIYLPEDTINVWGVVKARNTSGGDSSGASGAAGITNATLELTRSDYYWDESDTNTVIDSKELDISPSGTFISSIELAGYNPGSYNMRVKIGNETVINRYVQVMEYTKPAYKIELTPDKKAVYMGEKVNMGIQASFFEGSPLPGIKLDYTFSTGGEAPKSGSVTCDSAGQAKLELATNTSVNTWRPQGFYTEVRNSNAEEVEISAYSSIQVFPRDTMIDASGKIEDGKGVIDINTNLIDISRLNDSEDSYWDTDAYRGAPVDKSITAKLYETHYEAIETGDYYDYINKKTVKTYDYKQVSNLVQEYKIDTVQGKYKIEFPANSKNNYRLDISGYDSINRPMFEEVYVYNWMSYYPYYDQGYTLIDENGKTNYRQGDKVALKMTDNNLDMPAGNNYRYLYVRLKDGVLDYTTSKEASYTFEADQKLIPNMYVKAICFDGSNILDAGIKTLIYDREEKKLDIIVTPDKSSYKPGDTVKLSIDVRDEKGNPCNSEVNVSVVDEAFFAVADQYVYTLGGLYQASMTSGLISEFSSHVPLDESMYGAMAEGGEGGDVAIRSDFKDSALFASALTGDDGKGEISFRLPDNLTSWRVTCQSVTNDLKAGNCKINVSSRLPFFTDTVFNKVFMTGDSPSLLVRAYGTELGTSDKVEYSIAIENDAGFKKTYKASATGNGLSEISLGKLDEGSYTYTVEASSGALKDALQKSFKVSDSMLEAGRFEQYALSEGISIQGGKALTTLSFINKESADFYNELNSLYWSFGERIDQKLSRKLAGELLKKYFNEEYVEEEYDLSKYQTEDGGLALLSYDSSNPELSAEICSAAPGFFDEAALESYFYGILNNTESTPEDVAASYWGLAALNKPVLVDIKNLLESTELGLIERLELGNALAAIGDDQGAAELYKEVLSKYAKKAGDYTYIESPADRDDTVKATALCATIAIKINAAEKMQLFNYSRNNSTTDFLTNLERLIFVNAYMPGIQPDSSFTYTLDQKEQQVVLEKNKSYKLVLTPEKLKSIKFSNIKGNVTVSASYTGSVKDIAGDSGAIVGIGRNYSVNGNIVQSFGRSNLIKITLTPVFNESAPDGYYEITDMLPAGLRFVKIVDSSNRDWFLDEVSGQKVAFGYSYSKKTTQSITYYARAVSPGSFTADNAFIKLSTDDIFGFADQSVISVVNGQE